MRGNPYITPVLAFAGIILAGVSIYYGSILPLAKGRGYIAAEQNLSHVKNVSQFIANFDRVVRFPSPVGSEEVAKFLGSKILDIIAGINLPEQDTLALAKYADTILFKDDVRHLMISGHIWNMMWAKFKKDEYYTLAEARFRSAHEIGPKLPTPLYALFDIYTKRGEKEKAKAIREQISMLWPKVNEIPNYFGKE